MRIIVYLPLVLSALLAVAGPRATRRMPPRSAALLLLAAGVSSAVTSLFALGLLAATVIGQVPAVAATGTWSGPVLERYSPVSPVVAETAGAALVALVAAATWRAVRYARAVRRARRAAWDLGGTGRLAVLDRAEPEAFAVPASRREPGRIVVSAGLLRMLDAAERRVLLAHEIAHLDHRHHRYRVLAGLIATVNPLLITLPGAIHHLTERWADEEAAGVADRGVTARALARTALAAGAASRTASAGDAVQCFHRHGVPDRVRALLDGAPPRRPLAVLILAAFLAGNPLTGLEAGHDAAELFDLARDHAGGWATRPLPHPPEHGHGTDKRQEASGCGSGHPRVARPM